MPMLTDLISGVFSMPNYLGQRHICYIRYILLPNPLPSLWKNLWKNYLSFPQSIYTYSYPIWLNTHNICKSGFSNKY